MTTYSLYDAATYFYICTYIFDGNPKQDGAALSAFVFPKNSGVPSLPNPLLSIFTKIKTGGNSSGNAGRIPARYAYWGKTL